MLVFEPDLPLLLGLPGSLPSSVSCPKGSPPSSVSCLHFSLCQREKHLCRLDSAHPFKKLENRELNIFISKLNESIERVFLSLPCGAGIFHFPPAALTGFVPSGLAYGPLRLSSANVVGSSAELILDCSDPSSSCPPGLGCLFLAPGDDTSPRCLLTLCPPLYYPLPRCQLRAFSLSCPTPSDKTTRRRKRKRWRSIKKRK